MVDERCLALLDGINNACTDSGYKIFEFDELRALVLPRFDLGVEDIRECIKNLCYQEFISVKYEDEKEICVKPLIKGRLAFENRIEREITENKEKRLYLLYSALGGALGSAITSIIALIIAFAKGGA